MAHQQQGMCSRRQIKKRLAELHKLTKIGSVYFDFCDYVFVLLDIIFTYNTFWFDSILIPHHFFVF